MFARGDSSFGAQKNTRCFDDAFSNKRSYTHIYIYNMRLLCFSCQDLKVRKLRGAEERLALRFLDQ